MIEFFTWAATGLSVIGVILNAQRKMSGWYVFMVADLAWVGIGLYTKMYAMAALFMFYFFLCFFGVYSWTKKGGDEVKTVQGIE